MLSERVKPLKCCAKSFFLRCKSTTPNFLKNAVCYKVDLCSAGTGHQVTSSNPHKSNYSGADTGMSRTTTQTHILHPTITSIETFPCTSQVHIMFLR